MIEVYPSELEKFRSGWTPSENLIGTREYVAWEVWQSHGESSLNIQGKSQVKLLLHVGCGSKTNALPREFAAYKEVRLDSNVMVEPDVVASIVAMPMVHTEYYSAVFASHVLEHLYCHEVALALAEFHRVLKPEGVCLIHVPDLQSIGGLIALDQAENAIYQSGIGMIAPLDMLYGHRGSVGSGNLWMAHRTGFTQTVLKNALLAAGFSKVEMDRDTKYELKARAVK